MRKAVPCKRVIKVVGCAQRIGPDRDWKAKDSTCELSKSYGTPLTAKKSSVEHGRRNALHEI